MRILEIVVGDVRVRQRRQEHNALFPSFETMSLLEELAWEMDKKGVYSMSRAAVTKKANAMGFPLHFCQRQHRWNDLLTKMRLMWSHITACYHWHSK